MGFENALRDVAKKLGIDEKALVKLINFESGFQPMARNPFSGARGLIQFTHETARELGYKNSDDLVQKNPTIEKQLKGPVLKYLEKYKPFGYPFPQSLYLSVFYPAFRHSSPDTAFSDKVRSLNPSINFVGDYVAKVEGKTGAVKYLKKYSSIAFFLPLVVGALAVTYPYIKRRWKDERKRDGRNNGKSA